MHLSNADLARAQKATAKLLSSSLAETDTAAVVSLSGRVNTGFADRTTLQNAILQLWPASLYRNPQTSCPNMDYYQAELIVNEHNGTALDGATEEVVNCNPSLTLASNGTEVGGVRRGASFRRW